jgi:molybdopterin-synthase adenylyltransferase
MLNRELEFSRLEHTVYSHARMASLRAVVAGAGALGNEVVKCLGLLGLGHILIVDPDTVEPSNLTRSVFFRQDDSIGANKAAVMAQAAGKLFPASNITAFPGEIADVGFQHLRDAGIVFSCVDSDLARVEIAYIATKLNIPVSDGGLGTADYRQGRVSYFPDRHAACYGCLLSSRLRRDILTLWSSPARPCWDMNETGTGMAFPSTPTMSAMIGALQVELGLRGLLQPPAGAFTVELSLTEVPALRQYELRQAKNCPFHQAPGMLVTPCSESGTIHELLDQTGLADPVLVLDWPVCACARCITCGAEFLPMRRLADFRKRSRCPRCGARDLQEMETVYSVNRSSRWAGHRPADLGLPPSHMFSILSGDGA